MTTIMQPFQTYRHMSTLDTDLVTLIVKDRADHIIIRGYVLHRTWKIAYGLETYTILKEDLWKWKHVQG